MALAERREPPGKSPSCLNFERPPSITPSSRMYEVQNSNSDQEKDVGSRSIAFQVSVDTSKIPSLLPVKGQIVEWSKDDDKTVLQLFQAHSEKTDTTGRGKYVLGVEGGDTESVKS
ncbi:unnamed protein product [Lepeophtheirus salmonis]|uniref:(salmon louse) hypothetical protein n=1 Tax=Lepeophtheirus salmonis TaxID=72036 RepID=A0A7R8D0N9_LEPSM|nr:unnamed protein product [Lepeophtheirus salmonis]CAF2985797.1 unnamed protein product [Lepeophtheirus salmonis]